MRWSPTDRRSSQEGGRLRHRKKAGRKPIASINSCSRSSAAVWEEAIAQALVVRTLTDDKT
ncbi:hypothetical protein FD723_38855 (plasmid) [Nostoc sp. C052]|uniref:hypothetical protein n=1 Tax=Nostoc sp. C052 TaxID=2576902 RepID=UPI0015C37669|nr:hypothetical protein [Nostoc sp. C052]QLE46163.1 hypothetical protein FD723_38855 [Nostoc sp. C052]